MRKLIKIVIEIDPARVKREFDASYSNGTKRRLMENELCRQFIHEAVKRSTKEFVKWYNGEKTTFGL